MDRGICKGNRVLEYRWVSEIETKNVLVFAHEKLEWNIIFSPTSFLGECLELRIDKIFVSRKNKIATTNVMSLSG